MRVYLTEPKAVREEVLQATIAGALKAGHCNWSAIATRNNMPSSATPDAGAPTWACAGKRFWAATERETETTLSVYIGLVSNGQARPPDVAELARSGPRELFAVLRRYGGSHTVIVEMFEDARETSMVLRLPGGWKGQLLEPPTLQVPTGVIVTSAGAAIAHYAKYSSAPQALAVVGVGIALAAFAWLAAALTAAARTRPRWERNGWEVA
jgi:hypothetical protein